MASYITVDGGTTNTRLYLIENGALIATRAIPLGARANREGDGALARAMREAIAELQSLCKEKIARILSSGMITSEMGLCPLPHLPAPAGIAELHGAMHKTLLPEISEIPFVFMRGVKLTGKTLEGCDMMRGEETELMGIDAGRDALVILPGSHSKLIRTDVCGRISHFETLLTGEMMWALAKETILKDAFEFGSCVLSPESLLAGYRYAKEHGINAALFKVRVLRNLCGGSEDDAYSFFMGVTLADEIDEVIKFAPSRIVIGGRKAIREAMALLLASVTEIPVRVLSDDEVTLSVSRGMIRIYEYEV